MSQSLYSEHKVRSCVLSPSIIRRYPYGWTKKIKVNIMFRYLFRKRVWQNSIDHIHDINQLEGIFHVLQVSPFITSWNHLYTLDRWPFCSFPNIRLRKPNKTSTESSQYWNFIIYRITIASKVSLCCRIPFKFLPTFQRIVK